MQDMEARISGRRQGLKKKKRIHQSKEILNLKISRYKNQEHHERPNL